MKKIKKNWTAPKLTKYIRENIEITKGGSAGEGALQLS